uniref:Uncharacterized protein n=1 Tax=Anguilla anguilla TaxID=7936 RepID=A0A0E9RJ10_ANGAN
MKLANVPKAFIGTQMKNKLCSLTCPLPCLKHFHAGYVMCLV